MANSESWHALGKQHLFRLFMEELTGEAQISFVGNLQDACCSNLRIAKAKIAQMSISP